MAPDLSAHLSPSRNFVDGAWAPVMPESRLPVRDPNTGEWIGLAGTTTADEVERALAVSSRTHAAGEWQNTAPGERAAALDRIASALAERVEDLAVADAMTSGTPITMTREVATFVSRRFAVAARVAEQTEWTRALDAGGRDVRLLTLPWGPAAVLTPWNAPSFIAGSKIASALAAGCPVLFKPSEWAQPSGQVLAEAIASCALPPGVFQLLHGGADVGATLAADPRVKVLSFTGGLNAGRAIARAAANDLKHLQLELGGNNPVLVLADADVEAAAAAVCQGMLLLNGQWCEGPGKVLVHRSLERDFTAALTDRLGRVRVGHCLDQASELGPLANEAHFTALSHRISTLVAEGGVALPTAALPSLPGYFFSPKVVTGVDADLATAELFGPAVSVHPVDSDEEAVTAANRHPSGLDGYVFGTDLDHAMSIAARVTSGEVRVNGAHMEDLGDASAQSFWETSGIGGHGPHEPSRVFSGVRVIGVDDPTLPI